MTTNTKKNRLTRLLFRFNYIHSLFGIVFIADGVSQCALRVIKLNETVWLNELFCINRTDLYRYKYTKKRNNVRLGSTCLRIVT